MNTSGDSVATIDLDLLQGTLDVLILKTLSWGPRHGYAIARWVHDVSDDVLRVEELERLLERLRKPVERERVESRKQLPVQLERVVRTRYGADARDIAVVELHELDLGSRPPCGVVVRLEERLRPGEAVPHQEPTSGPN